MTLFIAALALALACPAAFAADAQTMRSVNAHPVVWDDYPAADVTIEVSRDVLLTVTGEARTRFEWLENTSDLSDGDPATSDDDDAFDDNHWFAPARFNLGFRLDLPRNVAAVVELQSAFDWGGNDSDAAHYRRTVNTELRPGVLNMLGIAPADTTADDWNVVDGDAARAGRGQASDDVRVYQAYVEAANIGDSIASIRVGRQELAYGTEMLLGNRDFYDGMSYDAVKGILEFNDNSRLDLFFAKLAETQLDGWGGQDANDTNMYGAYWTIQSLGGSSIGMDAYAIAMDSNADAYIEATTSQVSGAASFNVVDEAEAGDLGISYLESYWVGLRFFREREHGLHWSAELAYQFGNFEADHISITADDVLENDEIDINAWAFEGFLGYTWDHNTNPGIHVGVTYATGTDFGDFDAAEINTFFSPGGEIHPRLGLADMVELSNVLAYNLGYSGSSNNHSWGVDLWHFEMDEVPPWLDTWVLGTTDGAGLDDSLGEEVDLWYNYQYSKHLAVQIALSYFAAGDHFDDYYRCWTSPGGCDEDGILEDSDDDYAHSDDAWRLYSNLLLRF